MISLASGTYTFTAKLPTITGAVSLVGPATGDPAVLDGSAIETLEIVNVTGSNASFEHLSFLTKLVPALIAQSTAANGTVSHCSFAGGTNSAILGKGCANWIIDANTFRSVAGSDATAQPAIRFYEGATGTIVEDNLFLNCDRGIALGKGSSSTQSGGKIQNNFFADNRTTGAFPGAAISLESASNSEVDNNTIYQAGSYAHSIEYRYASTGSVVQNNLTNKSIAAFDGCTATLNTNYTQTEASFFVDVAACDLHLASAIAGVVGCGTSLPALPVDIDGDSRPSAAPIDIGADQYIAGAAVP